MTDNGAGKQLQRIGWVAAASLVVSNMVGSGIFTTSGFLLQNLRSPWLLLVIWAVGGALAVAGTLCYAELGASLPQVGGDYIYLRKAYGPLWAFFTGWMAFFAGIGAPIGLAALTCMEYLSTFVPVLTVQGHEPLIGIWGLTITVSAGQVAAAGLIWLLTGVHWLGIRTGGRWQSAITMLNVGLIAGFILAALIAGGGDWSNLNRLVPPESSASGSTGAMFAISLIWVMFAYSGFNAAAYVAGEIDNPSRNLPRGLITGVVTVTVMYLGLNLVYILAAEPGELAGKLDVARVAAAGLFGRRAEMLVSVVIVTCAIAATSAMICVGPRIYSQMARDGVFFAAAARIHPQRGTPGGALLLQAIWASTLIFFGSFDQLLTFTGFLLSLFSALSVASVIVLRRRFPDLPRPYKAWGYPVTPLLYVAVSLWMMVWSLFSRPGESLIGLGIVGAGLPVYYFWRRRSGAAPSTGEPTDTAPP
ncbi:MAG: amino acid permease [Candidatus Glassbacteria bacterium]|nr:amino acid permease [Candidatus Glassbacteria bacterium]